MLREWRLFFLLVCVSQTIAYDQHINSTDLELIIEEAVQEVEERRSVTPVHPVERELTPVDIHALVARPREGKEIVQTLGFAADVIETTMRIFTERFNKLPDPKVLQRHLEGICPKHEISCDLHNRYRTPEGVCNNRKHPEWGSAFTPQARFLPPDYGDHYNLGLRPRTNSVTGRVLPNPREISNAVFQITTSPKDPIYNINFVHFAQTLVWDVVSTPWLRDHNQTIFCCDGDIPVERPECFPIHTAPGEFQSTCMSFTRSEFAPQSDCFPGARRQMNMKTSYLDMNWLYGYTQEGEERLRQFGLDHPDNYDPLLTITTLTFIEEHGMIEDQLKGYGWKGEARFREARKILTAIYQHILYTEYLPSVIGHDDARKLGLLSKAYGFDTVYDPNVDASTRTAFGTAALRFHHSTVSPVNDILIGLFTPESVRDYTETIQSQNNRIFSEFQEKSDRFFLESIRSKLFETKHGNGFDLVAVNIQRGRDHGLPSYNKWREFCGLRPILYFGKGVLRIIMHPDDIDLYAGAVSENLVPGGIVGPTFQCIIAKQFEAYKKGDRFFYENDFPDTGFSLDQLNEIKKQSMSALHCRHFNVRAMPENSFVSTNLDVPLVPCQDFPALDLSLWDRRGRAKDNQY